MKRPAWATTVGVLGILFGAYGSLTNASMFMAMLRIRNQPQQPFAALQKTMDDPAVRKQMQENAQRLQQALSANAQQQAVPKSKCQRQWYSSPSDSKYAAIRFQHSLHGISRLRLWQTL